MNGHQRLEQFSMVGDSQMQQFMRNDKVLKTLLLLSQIDGESNYPVC